MNQRLVSQDFSKNFYSNRKKEKEKFNFGVNSTFLMLLGIIILLLLYYIWMLNVNATQGYNIRQLSLEKSNLMIEKEKLYAKIAELESLSNVMNDENLKNMEKIEEPDFLVIKKNVQYVYND